jgi:hypothetical protein
MILSCVWKMRSGFVASLVCLQVGAPVSALTLSRSGESDEIEPVKKYFVGDVPELEMSAIFSVGLEGTGRVQGTQEWEKRRTQDVKELLRNCSKVPAMPLDHVVGPDVLASFEDAEEEFLECFGNGFSEDAEEESSFKKRCDFQEMVYEDHCFKLSPGSDVSVYCQRILASPPAKTLRATAVERRAKLDCKTEAFRRVKYWDEDYEVYRRMFLVESRTLKEKLPGAHSWDDKRVQHWLTKLLEEVQVDGSSWSDQTYKYKLRRPEKWSNTGYWNVKLFCTSRETGEKTSISLEIVPPRAEKSPAEKSPAE